MCSGRPVLLSSMMRHCDITPFLADSPINRVHMRYQGIIPRRLPYYRHVLSRLTLQVRCSCRACAQVKRTVRCCWLHSRLWELIYESMAIISLCTEGVACAALRWTVIAPSIVYPY